MKLVIEHTNPFDIKGGIKVCLGMHTMAIES